MFQKIHKKLLVNFLIQTMVWARLRDLKKILMKKILNYESTGKGKVITVTSSKGGSGKSTDSTGIGAFLSEAGQKAFEQGLVDHAPKIITVDLDVKDGQLGYLNNATSPNIVNVYIARKDNSEKLTEEHIKEGTLSQP